MCVGKVSVQEHITATRSHPGYTRGGEGRAGLGHRRSAPPTPAPARPPQTPARSAVGEGAARPGQGGRGGPAAIAPVAPAVGGGEDIVAALPPPPPAKPPHERPLALRLPEREWSAARGRAGSSSNLQALKGAGRGTRRERGRSGARLRAATATLRRPGPPRGVGRRPRPGSPPPSRPRPPGWFRPSAPAPPAAHSEVSCAARGHAPGSLAAFATSGPPPAPPARARRPRGSLRARAAAVAAWPNGAVEGAGAAAAAGSRRAGGAGRGRRCSNRDRKPCRVRGDRAAWAMPVGTPPAAGAR